MHRCPNATCSFEYVKLVVLMYSHAGFVCRVFLFRFFFSVNCSFGLFLKPRKSSGLSVRSMNAMVNLNACRSIDTATAVFPIVMLSDV